MDQASAKDSYLSTNHKHVLDSLRDVFLFMDFEPARVLPLFKCYKQKERAVTIAVTIVVTIVVTQIDITHNKTDNEI